MKLLAAGQEYMIEIDEKASQVIIDIVNEISRENSLVFCGYYINGELFYGDIADVIKEKSRSLLTIEAILLPEDEVKQDTLISIHAFIDEALPQLNTLFLSFYEVPTEVSWMELANLVESLQWISKAKQLTMSSILPDFTEAMNQMEVAIFQKDTGLIGDVIQFEIIPQFEQVREALNGFLGGVTVDAN